ncbi:YdeI/OmpD-associated family protein [Methylovirgula sp. 4M-Z18]|uniref:YdeI/OmpD-associated family protein n=1 Tax=Methylovirgula sp. 4M-Z18 TaxID=2293567 RepID=UPI001FE093FA|nr:YdeI/OmpD-associated family protein [Methylovirgula sp. 4M-Z18]
MTTGKYAAGPKQDPCLKAGLPILSFATAAAWEAWLAAQPRDCNGLWLKFAKKGAPIPTIAKQEAIDGALCHGWIDGQLDKFDAHYWLVRFTPRIAKSKWSAINRARALELIAAGRMQPAGLREIQAAQQDGRWENAYDSWSTASVPDDLQTALDVNTAALQLFRELDSRNRYAILYRIHNAKKPETRVRKIADYVAMLARGETIYPRTRKSGKA